MYLSWVFDPSEDLSEVVADNVHAGKFSSDSGDTLPASNSICSIRQHTPNTIPSTPTR